MQFAKRAGKAGQVKSKQSRWRSEVSPWSNLRATANAAVDEMRCVVIGTDSLPENVVMKVMAFPDDA